jgi:hypothetical protein
LEDDMDFARSRSDAALVTLAILQLVMLGALFTQTPPHPPIAVAPFALGPFLGASISMAVAAIVLGATRTRLGTVVSVLAALLGLVSYGLSWFSVSKRRRFRTLTSGTE